MVLVALPALLPGCTLDTHSHSGALHSTRAQLFTDDTHARRLLARWQGTWWVAASGEPERWTPRDTALLRLLAEALASGAGEIRLGPGDLSALAGPDPLPLPDALYASATIAAAPGGFSPRWKC